MTELRFHTEQILIQNNNHRSELQLRGEDQTIKMIDNFTAHIRFQKFSVRTFEACPISVFGNIRASEHCLNRKIREQHTII
jgi:hypothetical protein